MYLTTNTVVGSDNPFFFSYIYNEDKHFIIAEQSNL